MKILHSLAVVSALAAASMFVACGDDSSTSSSGSDSKCEVTNGVVVVKPAEGESYKIGETITVVYGSDIARGGFNIEYRADADDKGVSLVGGSVGPENPDGKTCYEEKVVLKEGKVTPSDKAVIRVIPYNDTGKGKNSATFKVTE